MCNVTDKDISFCNKGAYQFYEPSIINIQNVFCNYGLELSYAKSKEHLDPEPLLFYGSFKKTFASIALSSSQMRSTEFRIIRSKNKDLIAEGFINEKGIAYYTSLFVYKRDAGDILPSKELDLFQFLSYRKNVRLCLVNVKNNSERFVLMPGIGDVREQLDQIGIHQGYLVGTFIFTEKGLTWEARQACGIRPTKLRSLTFLPSQLQRKVPYRAVSFA